MSPFSKCILNGRALDTSGRVSTGGGHRGRGRGEGGGKETKPPVRYAGEISAVRPIVHANP